MKDHRVDLKSLMISARTENEARQKAEYKLKEGFKFPDLQIADIGEDY